MDELIQNQPNIISVQPTDEPIKKSYIKYYENFKNKHKDDINKKLSCNICGGSYSYFNKSGHLKTKKCIAVKQLRQL